MFSFMLGFPRGKNKMGRVHTTTLIIAFHTCTVGQPEVKTQIKSVSYLFVTLSPILVVIFLSDASFVDNHTFLQKFFFPN